MAVRVTGHRRTGPTPNFAAVRPQATPSPRGVSGAGAPTGTFTQYAGPVGEQSGFGQNGELPWYLANDPGLVNAQAGAHQTFTGTRNELITNAAHSGFELGFQVDPNTGQALTGANGSYMEDPSNPFSRAATIRRSYDQAREGAKNSMGNHMFSSAGEATINDNLFREGEATAANVAAFRSLMEGTASGIRRAGEAESTTVGGAVGTAAGNRSAAIGESSTLPMAQRLQGGVSGSGSRPFNPFGTGVGAAAMTAVMTGQPQTIPGVAGAYITAAEAREILNTNGAQLGVAAGARNWFH